jgi:DNA repair photolyase
VRGSTEFRWRLAEDDGGQSALFADEELVHRHVGRGAYAGLEFLHVKAKTIISTVPPQSRVPFRHTINAYRGCSHACTYCFARPTHEYLGLGIGEDFERTLVVKVNAVERVRAELRSKRWKGDIIAMGTNTDPYQRAEGKYHLTAGIIDVLAEAANPFSILTKSTLILRDLDRLVAAAGRTEVRCNLSIATLDPDVWKATEPGTPHPRQRVEAVRRLNEAGIPTGVLIAPIIPGWSDDPDRLEEVTGACRAAGAVSVSAVPLHLRPGLKEHFLADLSGKRPELAEQLRNRYRGAYLPKAEQQAIIAPVTRTVVRLRPPGSTPKAWHPAAGGPVSAAAVEGPWSLRPPPPEAAIIDTDRPEQLSF